MELMRNTFAGNKCMEINLVPLKRKITTTLPPPTPCKSEPIKNFHQIYFKKTFYHSRINHSSSTQLYFIPIHVETPALLEVQLYFIPINVETPALLEVKINFLNKCPHQRRSVSSTSKKNMFRTW